VSLSPITFEYLNTVHKQEINEFLREQALIAQVRETQATLFDRVAWILNALFTRQTEAQPVPVATSAGSCATCTC
jgi:siroheme synthase